MIISKSRIRTLNSNLIGVNLEQEIIVGIKLSQVSENILRKIGFENIEIGSTILPSYNFGRVSKINAEGKYIVNKKLPKEEFFVEREWTWQQWTSGGGTEENSKTVYIRRERYHRDFIPPYAIEISIREQTNGEKVIVAPNIKYTQDNSNKIIHIINLFLEIFKECEIFTENLDSIITSPNIRLNWKILPSGQRTWSDLKTDLKNIIDNAKSSKKNIIENRFTNINKNKPDFVALGNGGFDGYVIFGFQSKNLFILESAYFGNATYIFGNDWERLSKMTKTEILTNNLFTNRVIHSESWESEINRILN